MEAATTSELIERTEQEAPVEVAARNGTAQKMFKYSEFINVGMDAADCLHAQDGQCQNTEHFHAWCRLPNPYQHEDIRKKGLAEKARCLRALRDPESDASVVLDEALSAIDDPVFMDAIIDELLTAEWADDYLQVQQDVTEMERFEHIDQDREEYARLSADEAELPVEEQSKEIRALADQMSAYVEALRNGMEAVQGPKRNELRGRGASALVELVRNKRIETDADRAFVDKYNAWMWFVGTFKVEPHPTLRRPHLPMWDDIGRPDRAAAGTMFGESPEVIEALKVTFNALQLALQAGSAGN